MGSSSRSNSSQATENNSISQGVQGDNLGNIINGSGNTITDGGAFKVVGDLVNTLPDIVSYGAGMVSDAFNASTDLVESNESTTKHFLDTGLDLFGDAMAGNQNMLTDSLEFGADSLAVVDGVVGDSLNMVDGVVGDALNYGLDSQENAFDFASGSQDSAFDFAGDALAVASGSQDGAFDFGRDALAMANDSMADSIGFAESTLTSGFDFGRDSLDMANDTYMESINFANSIADNNAALVDSTVESVARTGEIVAGVASDAMAENAALAGLSIDAARSANETNAYIAEKAIENSETVNSDAQKYLVGGFESMMDFAEDFSRSDGADLAKTNSNNTLIIAGVAAFSVVTVAIVMRGTK